MYMVNYEFDKDCKLIRDYFGLSQEELSSKTGISRVTISRLEGAKKDPSKPVLEALYTFAYESSFDLNSFKNSLAEDDKGNNVLLFHGAKGEIKGDIDTKHTIGAADFGKGFYAGETFEQASTWVSNEANSSVYAFYFSPRKTLRMIEFSADMDWMLAILYYRGRIEKYAGHTLVQKIVQLVEEADYVIAPIADNSMYNTLEEFAAGRITDVQCRHALSANYLGKQYVFKTEKALTHLKPIRRLYLCRDEKRMWANRRLALSNQGRQKMEASLVQYRREGKFIDELFS